MSFTKRFLAVCIVALLCVVTPVSAEMVYNQDGVQMTMSGKDFWYTYQGPTDTIVIQSVASRCSVGWNGQKFSIPAQADDTSTPSAMFSSARSAILSNTDLWSLAMLRFLDGLISIQDNTFTTYVTTSISPNPCENCMIILLNGQVGCQTLYVPGSGNNNQTSSPNGGGLTAEQQAALNECYRLVMVSYLQCLTDCVKQINSNLGGIQDPNTPPGATGATGPSGP